MSDLTDVVALLRSGALLLDQALLRINEQQATRPERSSAAASRLETEPTAELHWWGRGDDHEHQPTVDDLLLVLYEDRPDLAYVFGRAIPLRPAEYRLLARLMRTPRRVVRHEVLYDALWGGETFVEPGQVYSHVSRLRKKLAASWPEHLPSPIRTVQRVGVVLELHPAELALVPSGEGELH